jgi:hypothetical protein
MDAGPRSGGQRGHQDLRLGRESEDWRPVEAEIAREVRFEAVEGAPVIGSYPDTTPSLLPPFTTVHSSGIVYITTNEKYL